MKLGYLFKEGVKNAWSNRTMTIASIAVLVSCLLLTGSAVLFSMNLAKAMEVFQEETPFRYIWMMDYLLWNL